MAISKELLEILACPLCKTGVTLLPDGGGLRCGECGRVYPVRNDIPIMLVEEAAGGEGEAPAPMPPRRENADDR